MLPAVSETMLVRASQSPFHLNIKERPRHKVDRADRSG